MGAIVAAMALAGCSDGGEETVSAARAPAEIARMVDSLERATREGDYAAICDELFSAEARERAGGDDCESLLAEDAEGVTRPRLTLRSIEIDGDRAEARVRTAARGQTPADETIVFVREGGGYRISGLGG